MRGELAERVAEDARRLRQNNPFAGELSDEERQQVLQAARSAAVR